MERNYIDHYKEQFVFVDNVDVLKGKMEVDMVLHKLDIWNMNDV